MALILLAVPSSLLWGGHYPRCFVGLLPFPVFTTFLPYSSHTRMGRSRPREDTRASTCARGSQTAVEGFLSQLVRLHSFPDAPLLFLFVVCDGALVDLLHVFSNARGFMSSLSVVFFALLYRTRTHLKEEKEPLCCKHFTTTSPHKALAVGL